jgi:hypothetical protein
MEAEDFQRKFCEAQERVMPRDKPRAERSRSNGLAAPEPEQVRPFPTIGKAGFHGLAGDIVAVLKPHTESDPVALLLTSHVFFGNTIGRGPHYRVEGDRHHTNLFALLIGDTAKARKGTAAGRIRQLFKFADTSWEQGRIQTGLSSGEGLIWEVRDPITRMKDGEEQQTDSGAPDKRLMVLESEFGGALNAMGREGNILSRVIRDSWDSGKLNTLVKNNPARATDACISIVGHITADELRRYMTRTEMANGFANRFLFACVRRSQLLPFGGATLEEDVLLELGSKIAHAVNQARSIDRVTMHAEARPIWRETYAKLSESKPGLLGAITARAEAQVVRLGLVYALWDGRDQIEPPHLHAALAVWQFCADSVQYLFGDALGDPVADTILMALKGASEGMSRTDISNLFSRNAEAGQIGRALGELSRLKLAYMQKTPPAGEKGRPVETWFYGSV